MEFLAYQQLQRNRQSMQYKDRVKWKLILYTALLGIGGIAAMYAIDQLFNVQTHSWLGRINIWLLAVKAVVDTGLYLVARRKSHTTPPWTRLDRNCLLCSGVIAVIMFLSFFYETNYSEDYRNYYYTKHAIDPRLALSGGMFSSTEARTDYYVFRHMLFTTSVMVGPFCILFF